MNHGMSQPCESCQAQQAARQHMGRIENLGDAALVALADAIAEIRRQTEPPA